MEMAVIIPVCSRFPPAVTAFSSHVKKVLRFSLHSFIETYSNIYNIQQVTMQYKEVEMNITNMYSGDMFAQFC